MRELKITARFIRWVERDQPGATAFFALSAPIVYGGGDRETRYLIVENVFDKSNDQTTVIFPSDIDGQGLFPSIKAFPVWLFPHNAIESLGIRVID